MQDIRGRTHRTFEEAVKAQREQSFLRWLEEFFAADEIEAANPNERRHYKRAAPLDPGEEQ